MGGRQFLRKPTSKSKDSQKPVLGGRQVVAVGESKGDNARDYALAGIGLFVEFLAVMVGVKLIAWAAAVLLCFAGYSYTKNLFAGRPGARNILRLLAMIILFAATFWVTTLRQESSTVSKDVRNEEIKTP